MRRPIVILGSWVSLLLLACPVHAQTRRIPATYARGEQQLVTVDLHPGYGVTLNFRETGETIQRAWLDDPSQVTLNFDDPNCQRTDEASVCAARIIHLRRIERLSFPNLPATETTLLTVLTEENLYQFRLAFPYSGAPSYTSLNIQPNPVAPSQIAFTQMRGSSEVQVIEQGLAVAQARGWIIQGDRLWNRVQTFLSLLQDGTSATNAARQAGISQSLVIRLLELGQQSASLNVELEEHHGSNVDTTVFNLVHR